MSTLANEPARPRGTGTTASGMPSPYSIAVWLGATLITLFFALLLRDSALITALTSRAPTIPCITRGGYSTPPLGAAGSTSSTSACTRPKGLAPWPWAYDYLLVKVTQVALWVAPTLDPTAFISYARVAWIFVNAALFMAICRSIGSHDNTRLSRCSVSRVAANPDPPRIGMIDHHYVEHTFVLATIWLGLRWFENPDKHSRAPWPLGATLGLACAFHNWACSSCSSCHSRRVRAVGAQCGAAYLCLCVVSPSPCWSRRNLSCCHRSHIGA